ncbi:MAG: 16S rRNA (cytosine(967)-C(5))-methyltransferase RsmB [Cyanobacteriota bacterium]
MSQPRIIALDAIIDILERNQHADDVLSSVLNSHNLKKKDKALVTELVYGVTRNKLTLDFLLSKISKNDIKNLSFKIRNILRLGLYQLEFTRIPEYAAVNSSVEITKKTESKQAASFVNAVLRNIIKKRHTIKFPKLIKNPDYALSIRYSHPKWLVKRWLERFGLDCTIRLLSYNNMPAQTTININYLKTTIEEVIETFKAEGIHPVISEISPSCLKIGNIGSVTQLPGFYDGHWFVQDELSSLVVDILAPEENDLIIDMCAAPGVKTIKMSNYMNNKGRIIALDKNDARLKKIEENCYRLGTTNIECLCEDSTLFSLPQDSLADKILIDAPCTNTGVLSKRADARWNRRPADLEKLSKLQSKLLSNATNCLKPEGIIVYSVCSIEPEEGINIIEQFIKDNPNFSLLNLKEKLPESLKNTFKTDYIQFLPFEHLTDGFFIASVKKLY